MCYLQVRQPSPPPLLPHSSLCRPHQSLEGWWGLVGGGTLPDAHGCPSPPVSFTLSSRPSAVSPGTATCWVAFQTPTWCPTGGGTRTRTGQSRRETGAARFCCSCADWGLVLSEQSLMGPSAHSGTLLPGLNNECAGLPLELRARIISQGSVFSHVQGIRGWAGGIWFVGVKTSGCQQMFAIDVYPSLRITPSPLPFSHFCDRYTCQRESEYQPWIPELRSGHLSRNPACAARFRALRFGRLSTWGLYHYGKQPGDR